jgi:hypothetical protein
MATEVTQTFTTMARLPVNAAKAKKIRHLSFQMCIFSLFSGRLQWHGRAIRVLHKSKAKF